MCIRDRCRWLLQHIDRQAGDELQITHERIAGMLGVRREGITEAAGRLQAAGLISYRRGHISVVDRAGLEARACECYAVVSKELKRLLSEVQYRQDPPVAVDRPARPSTPAGPRNVRQ